MPAVIAPLTAIVLVDVVVAVPILVVDVALFLTAIEYPLSAVDAELFNFKVIVTLLAVADAVIVSVAATVNEDPLAVIVVEPCFKVTPLYPAFAVALAHTLVPASITVLAVNAVPVEEEVASYLVVKVAFVALLLMVYATMLALFGDTVPPVAAFFKYT